jgi:hypothetical protein
MGHLGFQPLGAGAIKRFSPSLPPSAPRWGEETLPDGRTLKYWVSPSVCSKPLSPFPFSFLPLAPLPFLPQILFIPRRQPTLGAHPGARGVTFVSCAVPTSATLKASCLASGAAWAWRTWVIAEIAGTRPGPARVPASAGQASGRALRGSTLLHGVGGAGRRQTLIPTRIHLLTQRPAWEPAGGRGWRSL